MKRTLMSAAVALAFLLMLPRPAPAQDLAPQLVGVWNLNSQLRKEVATGATLATFGEKPTGHIIFTRAGLEKVTPAYLIETPADEPESEPSERDLRDG